MSPQIVFPLSLISGYVAWLLCFLVYIRPKLDSMDRFDMHRAIATLHSFRFIGLAFIIPGVTGADLPPDFSFFAAYVDFATAILALLALVTVGIRPLFWFFVVAFNVVGIVDLVVDYFHAVINGVPGTPGELGSTYFIVIMIVPILMITSVYSLYSLARSRKA